MKRHRRPTPPWSVRVKARLKQMDLPQKDLAAELGIQPDQLSHYLKAHYPGPKYAAAIAAFVGIPHDELYPEAAPVRQSAAVPADEQTPNAATSGDVTSDELVTRFGATKQATPVVQPLPSDPVAEPSAHQPEEVPQVDDPKRRLHGMVEGLHSDDLAEAMSKLTAILYRADQRQRKQARDTSRRRLRR